MREDLQDLKDQVNQFKAVATAMQLQLELMGMRMREMNVTYTRTQVAIRQLEVKLLNRAKNDSA